MRRPNLKGMSGARLSRERHQLSSLEQVQSGHRPSNAGATFLVLSLCWRNHRVDTNTFSSEKVLLTIISQQNM